MLFQRPNYDWLIAGLGNPGSEYEKTRHNTGFMSLDLLAARLQVKVSKERFKALTAQADFDGQRLLLMKPLTFMNASGIAIGAVHRLQNRMARLSGSHVPRRRRRPLHRQKRL